MNFKLSFGVLIMSYVASPSMGQVGSSIDSAVVQDPKEDLKNLVGKQKMDQSTSLMARPGPPVGLSSRLNQLEAEFREKMEEIKTQTSTSIKDQNEKITKVMGWEHKLAHLLNQSMEVMRELKTQNRDQSKRIDQLEQKVAILQNTLPSLSALTRGNDKDNIKNGASINNDQVSKALNPPSSCKELADLDHFLDGLYLVKNKQTKKIQTVLCKFSSDNKVSQQLIGQVDVKTKSVHFYVQRESSFNTHYAVIPFELARLNEGGAFDLPSGVFTSPVSGIYHFQLSALKSYTVTFLDIYLVVNGKRIGETWTQEATPGSFEVVSLSASLRLTSGDRVCLYSDGSGMLHDKSGHLTHFSGWLVEEDLM